MQPKDRVIVDVALNVSKKLIEQLEDVKRADSLMATNTETGEPLQEDIRTSIATLAYAYYILAKENVE